MADAAPPLPRVYDEGWIVGTLIAHGAAPYGHEPGQSMSYFMRLQTLESERGAQQVNTHAQERDRPVDAREAPLAPSAHRGGVREIWSQDLKRAIRQSKSRVAIGMVVAAKIIAREPLPRPANAKDTNRAYRNLWEVETPQFVERRKRFAKAVNENYREARRDGVEGREALGLYLIHAGARAVANERFANAQDREAFIARVQEVIEAAPNRTQLIAQAVHRLKLKTAVPLNASPSAPGAAHDRKDTARARE